MILNAIMCVWNEEDIIESTVRHCFAQGCLNVFFIDNASTDRTVEIATNAGAKLIASFQTKYFDEDQKVAHLNAAVEYVNSVTDDDRIWWMFIDADEFPNFDCKLTIFEMLNNLDPLVRAVHGSMYDHTPTHKPFYVSGFHPADFQPVCSKSTCTKIPLLRFDKEQPQFFSIGGAHDFITHGQPIPVVKDAIQIHHFPYRNPEYSLTRSTKLVFKGADSSSRIDWHDKFLKQVHNSDSYPSQYQSRHKKLKSIYTTKEDAVLKENVLIYDFTHIKRHYDIEKEKGFISSKYEKSLHLAIYHYFLRQYEISLCRFKDALDICDNPHISSLILLKIAECFSYTDIEAANSIIDGLMCKNNPEIATYICECKSIVNNQNKVTPVKKNGIIYKIDLHNTDFPPTIEAKYKKIMSSIKLLHDF